MMGVIQAFILITSGFFSFPVYFLHIEINKEILEIKSSISSPHIFSHC